MKIYFYHELPGGQHLSIEDVFQGAASVSGGMGRICISRDLAALGHEVHVFHYLQGGQKENITCNVFCHRVTNEDEFVFRCQELSADDVVIVNQFDGLPRIGRKLYKVQCIKLVWAGVNFAFEWCDLIDQRHFHRLVCVSKESKEPYRLHRNFPYVESIYTSSNNWAQFPPVVQPIPDSVAYVGALRPEKGFQHLLSAWPLVRKKRPQAKLWVFGSVRLHFPEEAVGRTGVMTPEFEKKYLDPILSDSLDWREMNIEFIYPLGKKELFENLSQIWVGVVNPNLSGSTETYCLSAVEMQACGCPCIGAGTGGLLETIKDGESGFHLRTQNPQELADKIILVLSNASLQKKLSEGAISYSKDFVSSQREAEDWIKVIRRAKIGEPSHSDFKPIKDLGRFFGVGDLKILAKRVLGRIMPLESEVMS